MESVLVRDSICCWNWWRFDAVSHILFDGMHFLSFSHNHHLHMVRADGKYSYRVSWGRLLVGNGSGNSSTSYRLILLNLFMPVHIFSHRRCCTTTVSVSPARSLIQLNCVDTICNEVAIINWAAMSEHLFVIKRHLAKEFDGHPELKRRSRRQSD